jgi:hypothetical protein
VCATHFGLAGFFGGLCGARFGCPCCAGHDGRCADDGVAHEKCPAINGFGQGSCLGQRWELLFIFV